MAGVFPGAAQQAENAADMGVSMKSRRQSAIWEIVAEHEVETQEELMELLHARGFKVTQATISRDIKELRLAKIADGRGGYRYSLPATITVGI